MRNPSIEFRSMCIVDGDSSQAEDLGNYVIKLPGGQPELEVFQNAYKDLEQHAAILTVSCQRGPEAQDRVVREMHEVLQTNRDPHLIFNQLGIKIGFVSETIVRGAFLALWVRTNHAFCESLGDMVRALLGNGQRVDGTQNLERNEATVA